MIKLELQDLYRLSIEDHGSYYWKLIDTASDGLLWSRIGFRDYLLVDYADMVTGATDKTLIGKKVEYTPFGR